MPALTVAAVRKLAPQAQRREVRDTLAPGLYLVVQPTGAKSWAMRFRRPDGRPAKLTLGAVDLSDREAADEPALGGALTLRQARQLANQIDRQRARGVDVVQEHARRSSEVAYTFETAAREFFIEYKVRRWGTRPRRWRGDARLLGFDWPRDGDPAQVEPEIIAGGLAERWSHKPVTEMDADAIHAVVDEARRRGVPGLERRNKGASENRARKMHSALSVLFKWLLKQRRIASNPVKDLAAPGAPAPGDRALNDAEIAAFWRGCEQLGAPYGDVLKLLLLTGARLNEVVGMRRSEVSEAGEWLIPATRAKNHRPNLLPLPSLALDLILSQGRRADEHVFSSNPNGTKRLTGWSRAKARLDELNGIPPWVIHDLRRTASTGMNGIGVQPHVVEAVLNHVSGARRGVAGTYNVAEYRNEKRDALQRWAAHVKRLAS
jgi:integrase